METVILLMEEILHQLIGSLSHYLQGFIHRRWCRISSINSILDACKLVAHRRRLSSSIVSKVKMANFCPKKSFKKNTIFQGLLP